MVLFQCHKSQAQGKVLQNESKDSLGMFTLHQKTKVNRILLKTVSLSRLHGLETFATTKAHSIKIVKEAIQSMTELVIPDVESTVPRFKKLLKKHYVSWFRTYFHDLTHLTHLYRLDIPKVQKVTVKELKEWTQTLITAQSECVALFTKSDDENQKSAEINDNEKLNNSKELFLSSEEESNLDEPKHGELKKGAGSNKDKESKRAAIEEKNKGNNKDNVEDGDKDGYSEESGEKINSNDKENIQQR